MKNIKRLAALALAVVMALPAQQAFAWEIITGTTGSAPSTASVARFQGTVNNTYFLTLGQIMGSPAGYYDRDLRTSDRIYAFKTARKYVYDTTTNPAAWRNKEVYVRVRNSWKTLTDYDGQKYTFFFGSNGQALKATLPTASSDFRSLYQNNVVVKEVNGKRYGFDAYGHLVSGLWAQAPKQNQQNTIVDEREGKFFYFNENGTYNKSKTSKIRKAATYSNLFSAVKPYLGKAVSVNTSANNFDFNLSSIRPGQRVRIYTYDNYQIVTAVVTVGGQKTRQVETFVRVHPVATPINVPGYNGFEAI